MSRNLHDNDGFVKRTGPEDELVDIFPGSGAVGKAWESWRNQTRLAV